MPLTLTISDNFDATANVTASGTGGGTIRIMRASVAVGGAGSYSEVGTISGDGSTSINGGGYYNWYLEKTGSATTSTTYFPVLAGGNSVYDRCLTMIADRIKTLDLPSVDSSHVYVREIPVLEDGTMETPCVVVSDYGQQEEVREGTNGQDDYAYPVSVLFIESQSPQGDDDEARRRNLRIREAIHRAIDHIAPWDLRVPEVYQCEVRPAEVINADWEQQYSIRASGLVVNCIARQNRGTTLGSAVTLT